MQAFVPKNRRPRFELILRIIDLNNIPLVSGTAYIKWRLPSSNSNEHHGSTDKTLILDHKASWNYERTLQLRLTIDRDQGLHECEIQFDVIQEFSAGGHNEKNLLGRVKLNLCEYVDKSDDDEGIIRRYLMQDSKINSTLKIGISVQQMEGDRNFTTPPLKSAMAFGGITGVVASEQAEADDMGQLPLINTQSREVADMQEMYRRTLAASWTSRADDLPADKLIEGLFSGNVGWDDPQGTEAEQPAGGYRASGRAGGAGHTMSRSLLSPNLERRARSTSRHQIGNKVLDFSPAIDHTGKRGSIEHQLYDNAQGKSWRNRNTELELSEFDVRLLKHKLLRPCPPNTICAALPFRGVLARYQSSSSDFTDPDHNEHKRGFRISSNRRNSRMALGVNTLGRPGEVVVMKERRQSVKERPQIDAPPFILSEIEQESISFNDSELNERIDSIILPYQSRDRFTVAEWEEIRSRLLSSFTRQQLFDYISQRSEKDKSTQAASIRPESTTVQWRPGTSHFIDTGSTSQELVSERTGASQSYQKKELLAERVLRDHWKIGIAKEIGQLDIRLSRHTLSLLLGSNLFSFEELANLSDAKIDVTKALGLVRVTGNQSTCEYIREIIDGTVDRIRQEEFDLLPHDSTPKSLSRVLSADFLSWIEKTYRVTVQTGSSRSQIRLSYLLENKSSAEDARRTLNLALTHAASTSLPFSTYMTASELSDFHDVHPEDTAPWPDRQKSWFRWEKPASIDRFIADSFFSKDHRQLSDELLKLLRTARYTKAISGSIPQLQESVTAAFGKSLFLRKPSVEEKQLSASQLGKMALPKTFIKDVPRAGQLLRMLTPHVVEEGFRSHRIQLVPSALHANIFPKIELEVTIAPDGTNRLGDQCVISSAKAVMAENIFDYLVPEGAVDIRFARKLTHELLAGPQEAFSLDALHAQLRECLNESMASDIEIPLPRFAPITLPAHLIRRPAGETDSKATATAEYMYLPVNDIQGTQVHEYEFKGQQLFFGAYESGPFNPPATTDVYLQLDVDNSESRSPATPIEEQFNSLYNAACSLSFELNMLL
ncbi:mitochondrial inner-membrane-bound regulator-domain-containing protein [Aspergillus californicus]